MLLYRVYITFNVDLAQAACQIALIRLPGESLLRVRQTGVWDPLIMPTYVRCIRVVLEPSSETDAHILRLQQLLLHKHTSTVLRTLQLRVKSVPSSGSSVDD